jgi:hypothetical protein
MRRKGLHKFHLLFLLGLFGGCATPLVEMAPIDREILTAAKIEIAQVPDRTPSNVSAAKADQDIKTIYKKILSAARAECIKGRQRTAEQCNSWVVQISNEPSFNAFAFGENEIGINTGVLSLATPSEVAFVLAHEIGHHANNHIFESRNNQLLGVVIGGLAGVAAIDAVGACDERYQECSYEEDFLESTMGLGQRVGALTYSRAQELEADKFAVNVILRSGFRIQDARSIMMFLGSDGGRRISSTFGDTHPTGPERLVYVDTFYKEYREEMRAIKAVQGEKSQIMRQISNDKSIYVETLGITVDEALAGFGKGRAKVLSVDPKSPGGKLGLRVGDVLMAADMKALATHNNPTDPFEDFGDFLLLAQAKDKIDRVRNFVVHRGGKFAWSRLCLLTCGEVR